MTRQNRLHKACVFGEKRKKLAKKTIQRKIKRGVTILHIIEGVDRYRTFVRAQIKEVIHNANKERDEK